MYLLEYHLINGDSFLMVLASVLRRAHHRTLGPFQSGGERNVKQINPVSSSVVVPSELVCAD